LGEQENRRTGEPQNRKTEKFKIMAIGESDITVLNFPVFLFYGSPV